MVRGFAPPFRAVAIAAPDVAGVDRLQEGPPSADQRQKRGHACHRGEAIEKLILGPEHKRRPQNDRFGKFRQHGRLAGRLGAAVLAPGFAIRTDGRDVHEGLGSGLLGRLRCRTGACHMHGVKSLRAGFDQDADEVHHCIGAIDRTPDRVRDSEGWPAQAESAPRLPWAADDRPDRAGASPHGCASRHRRALSLHIAPQNPCRPGRSPGFRAPTARSLHALPSPQCLDSMYRRGGIAPDEPRVKPERRDPTQLTRPDAGSN